MTFSCTVEFSASTLVCILVNLGKPIFITMAIVAATIGIVTAKITDNDGLNDIAISSAPMKIPGERMHILNSIFIKFCICVISFVSLVTSDAVENLSILANENF